MECLNTFERNRNGASSIIVPEFRMLPRWFMNIALPIAAGLLAGLFILLPRNGAAQDNPASSSEPKLTEQEERGRGVFLQRCALCHLPKIQKPKTVPAVAPLLDGVLKNAPPAKEATVRNQILKGSPNMPGFQYGLDPKELDDLIAYVKTL
ncbi:MAG: hypothetical protein A3H28_02895 [Acidobacteria bacterium RIFCSPLOWO2_02_FULL_61_28]|nr:MAG: hypothetical protein A3H28_02895 [Acidobacteria bacterium RIFCSPLOWO2_02_FULL_61_28]